MNYHITLTTACDGKLETIKDLFSSLEVQSRLPDQIILLVYKHLPRKQFNQFVFDVNKRYPVLRDRLKIVSCHNSSHQPGSYHGYDRQFLVEQSVGISSTVNHSSSRAERGISGKLSQGDGNQSQFRDHKIPGHTRDDVSSMTLMIDIDNIVAPDFVHSLVDEYQALKETTAQDLILAPTVMRRQTDRVQSQGISGYSFLIPKYRYASFTVSQSPQQVKMMGGNCLFGPTQIFQSIGFDEEFAYSYEDIDFTYRLTQSGVPLYVTATTVTHHMESQRSVLDRKLIGSSISAYYRMRNHILFVRKNATLLQKIQAYGFGIWGLYTWFMIHILFYGGEKRWEIIGGLSRGLWDGLTR